MFENTCYSSTIQNPILSYFQLQKIIRNEFSRSQTNRWEGEVGLWPKAHCCKGQSCTFCMCDPVKIKIDKYFNMENFCSFISFLKGNIHKIEKLKQEELSRFFESYIRDSVSYAYEIAIFLGPWKQNTSHHVTLIIGHIKRTNVRNDFPAYDFLEWGTWKSSSAEYSTIASYI